MRKHSIREENNLVKSEIVLKSNLDEFLNGNKINCLIGDYFYPVELQVKDYIKENGKYHQVEETVRKFLKAEFYIDFGLSIGVLQAPYHALESFVKDLDIILKIGESGLVQSALVERIEFNINKMNQDFPDQWRGTVQKTDGKIRTAIFFGEDIKNDETFGEGYDRSVKNALGLYTTYFSNSEQKEKYQVSKKGILTFYSRKNLKDVIQFITSELKGYIAS